MDHNNNHSAAGWRWTSLRVATLSLGVLTAGAAWFYYSSLDQGSVVQTSAACPADPATYVMKPIGDKRFEVSLTLARPAQALDIVSRMDDTRSVATDDFIENVRYRSAVGDEVPLHYMGEGTWRMPSVNEARPTIIYEIDASHDEHPWGIGKEEIAYNFDGSSFFTGWTVLLTDYASYRCPFRD